MNANICHKTFADINIDDIFFQSLKEDYPEFVSWFKRKSTQDAFVQYDENGNISGFLYLKIEEKVVEDVNDKVQTLNGFFHIIDYTTDKIALATDRVVDGIASIFHKLMFSKKKKKKKESDENE